MDAGGETPRIGGSTSQSWLEMYQRTDSSSSSRSTINCSSPSPVLANRSLAKTSVHVQRTSSMSGSWALRPFHVTAREQFLLDPVGISSDLTEANSPTPREHTARRARDIASLKEAGLVRVQLGEQPNLPDDCAGADPMHILKIIHARLADAFKSSRDTQSAQQTQRARTNSRDGTEACFVCGQPHIWCACTSQSTVAQRTLDLEPRSCMASSLCQPCGQQMIWCTCSLIVAKRCESADSVSRTCTTNAEPLIHYLSAASQQQLAVTSQEAKQQPSRSETIPSASVLKADSMLRSKTMKQSPLSERTNVSNNNSHAHGAKKAARNSNSSKQDAHRAKGTRKRPSRGQHAATVPTKSNATVYKAPARKTVQMR